MIIIAVASKNPVKMEAVRDALSVYLNDDIELGGVTVESGVSNHPMSDTVRRCRRFRFYKRKLETAKRCNWPTHQ